MKTIAASLFAAALLATIGASQGIAATAQDDTALGSGISCPPNAISCLTPRRPGHHPRCYTVSVPDGNGGVLKRRVCG